MNNLRSLHYTGFGGNVGPLARRWGSIYCETVETLCPARTPYSDELLPVLIATFYHTAHKHIFVPFEKLLMET